MAVEEDAERGGAMNKTQEHFDNRRLGQSNGAVLLDPPGEWVDVPPAALDYGLPIQQIQRMDSAETGILREAAERLIGLAALLATLPVSLLVGLAIWVDSPGPVLFRQWRVGKGGKLFRFTKFRTYHADAKEKWPELYTYRYTSEEVDRPCFKVPGDPRATRVGRWLRQSTLDELPNFWHVAIGDMALVGPRPEIPEMLPYYRPEELAKFTVRPGVTGISQISGRGLLRFRETAKLDLEYVRTRTFWGDVRIAFVTVSKVIFRTGAF